MRNMRPPSCIAARRGLDPAAGFASHLPWTLLLAFTRALVVVRNCARCWLAGASGQLPGRYGVRLVRSRRRIGWQRRRGAGRIAWVGARAGGVEDGGVAGQRLARGWGEIRD